MLNDNEIKEQIFLCYHDTLDILKKSCHQDSINKIRENGQDMCSEEDPLHLELLSLNHKYPLLHGRHLPKKYKLSYFMPSELGENALDTLASIKIITVMEILKSIPWLRFYLKKEMWNLLVDKINNK